MPAISSAQNRAKDLSRFPLSSRRRKSTFDTLGTFFAPLSKKCVFLPCFLRAKTRHFAANDAMRPTK
jgi:hypothetical protein